MLRFAGVLAALCLCACYQPSFRDCAIACTSDCPADLMCDTTQHMCRLPGRTGTCSGSGGIDAAVDAALDPNADNDGDGVKNSADNCPLKPNPMQENEDMDLLGDVCDPCPISPNNTDSDSDGVGDDCDPNPTPVGGHTIMDTIELFDGFGAGLGPNEMIGGTGSIQAGTGVVELDGQGHYEEIVSPLAPSAGGETITTAFDYKSAPGPTSGGGPMTLVNRNSLAGIACVLFADTTNQGEVDIEETANQSYDGNAQVSDPPTIGVHTLRVRRFPNGAGNPTINCADGMMSAAAAEPDVATPDGGLFVQDVNAAFHYVMVVASGT